VSSFNAGDKDAGFLAEKAKSQQGTGVGTLQPLQEEEDLDATPVVPFLKSPSAQSASNSIEEV
jgi:hypothetical protein